LRRFAALDLVEAELVDDDQVIAGVTADALGQRLISQRSGQLGEQAGTWGHESADNVENTPMSNGVTFFAYGKDRPLLGVGQRRTGQKRTVVRTTPQASARPNRHRQWRRSFTTRATIPRVTKYSKNRSTETAISNWNQLAPSKRNNDNQDGVVGPKPAPEDAVPGILLLLLGLV
jgi:hypothetical protein